MGNDNLNDIINRLVASTDNIETRDIYADWAESYDNDLEGYGYVAPQTGVALLAGLLPEKTAKIADIGCGTGRVGQFLAEIGYTDVEGGDYSPDMLAKAAACNCYTQLHTIDLTAPIPLKSAAYDAAICIGVYSSRFNEHFFPQMLRILKPNAPFVISVRPNYFGDDVKPQLDKLEADQKLFDLTTIEKPYMQGQGAQAHYITFRKR